MHNNIFDRIQQLKGMNDWATNFNIAAISYSILNAIISAIPEICFPFPFTEANRFLLETYPSGTNITSLEGKILVNIPIITTDEYQNTYNAKLSTFINSQTLDDSKDAIEALCATELGAEKMSWCIAYYCEGIPLTKENVLKIC